MPIKKIYESSELAKAAYADLSSGDYSNADESQLTNAGMSSAELQAFTSRWPEVIEQYHDPATDLVVTVFRNGDELAIAVRGTVPDLVEMGDIVSDLQLGIGMVPDQYFALKSFYEDFRTTAAFQNAAEITVSRHPW